MIGNPVTDPRKYVGLAQVALAGPEISLDKLDFLIDYANELERCLLSTKLTRHELAWVLVSIAYAILHPKNQHEPVPGPAPEPLLSQGTLGG